MARVTRSLALVGLAALLGLVPRFARAEGAATLSGNFAYAGGEAQEKALRQAIEDLVSDMSLLVRGIARDRLIEAAEIEPRIEAKTAGDVVSIARPPNPFRSTKLDGTTIQFTNAKGKRITLSRTAKGGAVVETGVREDGNTKRTVFRLSADGKRLTLSVSISGPKLPRPLRYSLSYKRL